MPKEKHKFSFDTLALHGGQLPDSTTGARAVPIYRTSSFVFKNTQHAADLFALKKDGFIYTRISNPTQEVLEKRMALLEGAPAAVALASGTSAIFNTIINICSQGDELIAANNLYGGTFTMFDCILPQFGIHCHFVDPGKMSHFKKAITKKTKAIFVESIGNPSLDVIDLREVAEIARQSHLPLIVDSTFATPYLLQPLQYGANIVVHSLTKWLGGHGAAIGGIVVDGGNFAWDDPKFTLYNEPDASYHGLRYAHDLGDLNRLAFSMRLRLVPLRNLGACISPDNAWLFLQGLETLPLRMRRHCDNAMAVAQFLKEHPLISWVRYPGLETDPSYAIAKKYFQRGFGGVVVFGIKGGAPAGAKFIDHLQLFSHLANVGDAKSLAIHPATTTHSQLSTDQQKKAGILPELIRLSIGLEDIEDLIWDLEQALKKAAK